MRFLRVTAGIMLIFVGLVVVPSSQILLGGLMIAAGAILIKGRLPERKQKEVK